MFENYRNLCLLVFSALLITVAFSGFQLATKGLIVETNLNNLLPDSQQHIINISRERIQKNSGNTAILLASGNDQEPLEKFTQSILDSIESSPLLELVDSSSAQNDIFSLVETLKKYPFNFLSKSHKKLLLEGQKQQLFQQEIAKFFDIGATQGIISPSEDPLSLINSWFLESYTPSFQTESIGQFNYLDAGSLPHAYNIVVMFRPKGDSLNIKTMEEVSNLVKNTNNAKPNEIEIYRSGVVFHAAESAQKSKKDIQFIALGSTLGITFLFLLYFSGLRQLFLSLSSIAFACISATAISHMIFGHLHLFTLVFGASLIGITVDYSLHYFAKKYELANSSAHSTIDIIFPAIFLGLISSVIGFACLFFSSIPSLDQIATFCIIGLASAWLFVVVVYPGLQSKNKEYLKTWGNTLITKASTTPSTLFRNIRPKPLLYSSAFLTIALALIVSSTVKWSEDIRTLNSSSPQLLKEESFIRDTLSLPSLSQYIVIRGFSAEEILKYEEILSEELENLVQSNKIKSFTGLSKYIPSESRQKSNQRIADTHLSSGEDSLEKFMRSIGFSEEQIGTQTNKFTATKNSYLNFNTWKETAPNELSTLWVGETTSETESKTFASIILFTGLNDISALETITPPNSENASLYVVNNIKDISRSLEEQRSQAIKLLAVGYIAISIILVLIHKSLNVIRLVFVPALSSLLSLLALSLFHIEINLFHIFGLFLILGLGMDYSIFTYKSSQSDTACTSAIFLSAITSILAFGLLSFSQIPMLHSFGICILIGSIFNFVLAPIAKPNHIRPNTSPQKS